jgi:hypothetical protein
LVVLQITEPLADADEFHANGIAVLASKLLI